METNLIPIGDVEVLTNDDNTDSTDLSAIIPDSTTYAGLAAQIHVEGSTDFADNNKVIRYGFNDRIDSSAGLPMGDNEVIMLQNLSQINAFNFITYEDGVTASIQIQFFQKDR
jgi:hypothetical protein